MRKMMIMPLVALAIISVSAQGVLACTTGTPGYWKNHPEAWPTGIVRVGSTDYSLPRQVAKNALMEMLTTNPGKISDKLLQAQIILKQKIVAAQLSMLKYPGWTNPDTGIPDWGQAWYFDGYTGGMVGLISDANTALQGTDRAEILRFASLIDYWLNYWDRD